MNDVQGTGREVLPEEQTGWSASGFPAGWKTTAHWCLRAESQVQVAPAEGEGHPQVAQPPCPGPGLLHLPSSSFQSLQQLKAPTGIYNNEHGNCSRAYEAGREGREGGGGGGVRTNNQHSSALPSSPSNSSWSEYCLTIFEITLMPTSLGWQDCGKNHNVRISSALEVSKDWNIKSLGTCP